jgi:hypothetical protein
MAKIGGQCQTHVDCVPKYEALQMPGVVRCIEFYRPASFRLLVALGSQRLPVIRLAETLLGYAERAGTPLTWVLDSVPSRQFARAMLASQFSFDVALWGDESWTDRTVDPEVFRSQLQQRVAGLRGAGLSPRTLVSYGTAYHTSVRVLATQQITEVVHARCGTTRRTTLPRGLGYGVSDIPLTRKFGPSLTPWQQTPGGQLERDAARHKTAIWLIDLAQQRSSPRAMRQLRTLIEHAGLLRRRGVLQVGDETQQLLAA